MLAKVWKKILMAVLVIACLFNIMTKIVNKVPLESQLDSVKDGESLTLFVKDKEIDQ